MDARSSNSFADSLRLLLEAVLAGMAELVLCRSWAAGLLVSACFVPFSPHAAMLALLGALAATAWPFWRQRDIRLLRSGWYGVNGALCGFLVDWHFVHPLGGVVLTLLAAWAAAMILDAIVFALGDEPVGLPPLTIPFLVIAAAMTLAAPSLRIGMERMAPGEIAEPASPAWVPPPPDAATAAAWADYGTGDHHGALAGFLRLTDKAPERAEPWNGLGWSQFQLADAEGAGKSFAAALALDPHHPYALDGLGWVALARGEAGDAERRFRSAAAALPAWADPYVGWGWAVYAGGRYGEAERLFRRGLDLAPHWPAALSGLGWLSLRAGDHQAALALFSEAVAGDRAATPAREGLGRTLIALGRHGEAEAVFLDLLGQSPAAIRGVADTRRLMLVHGETGAADPREWQAVADLVGWKGLFLVLLAATVLIWTPISGLIGLSLMAASMAVAVILAGPASLLWIDLHVQTVAMIGLLMRRPRYHSGLGGLLSMVAVGVVVWWACHRWGGWLPLISFNVAVLAGMLGLRWRRRRFAFRSSGRGSIFSPNSADTL